MEENQTNRNEAKWNGTQKYITWSDTGLKKVNEYYEKKNGFVVTLCLSDFHRLHTQIRIAYTHTNIYYFIGSLGHDQESRTLLC